MTIDKMIELLQAANAGKKLQRCTFEKFGPAEHVFEVSEYEIQRGLNFYDWYYRIKPDPEPKCFDLPLSKLRGRWVRSKTSTGGGPGDFWWPIEGIDCAISTKVGSVLIFVSGEWLNIERAESQYELIPEDE